MAYQKMGEALLSAGAITRAQLDAALEIQRETHRRLGEVLVTTGALSERQLVEALERQLDVPALDLSRVDIPRDLARLVPESLAKKHSVVPVAATEDELILAMADPLNFVALEDIRDATHLRVTPRIAAAGAVDRAIAALYEDESAASAIRELEAAQSRPAVHDPSAAGPSAPTVRLVDAILGRAVANGASDVHIEPQEDAVRVRLRVDGFLRPGVTIPKDLQGQVIARVKVLGGMDVAQRRVPQDGRATVQVGGREVDLRVSSLPTIHGEKVVLRLLERDSRLQTPEDLGLSGEELEKYYALLSGRGGMVLIAGPTGAGKSSTLRVMLRTLNAPEVNVVTLEDPVEYRVPGVNQIQINEKTGLTFAGGLRAVLRQDPDVIAVGEIRDGETAEIALRSAITGHLVLSTIHADDAPSGVDRLLDMGVEPHLVGDALKGVIAQRLVRRVCPRCREAYTASEEELRWLGLPPGAQQTLYKGKGCPACGHTGCQGRLGVFEVLILSREARARIAQGRPRGAWTALARGENFTPLRANCARLALAGVTTVDEARRAAQETPYEAAL